MLFFLGLWTRFLVANGFEFYVVSCSSLIINFEVSAKLPLWKIKKGYVYYTQYKCLYYFEFLYIRSIFYLYFKFYLFTNCIIYKKEFDIRGWITLSNTSLLPHRRTCIWWAQRLLLSGLNVIRKLSLISSLHMTNHKNCIKVLEFDKIFLHHLWSM